MGTISSVMELDMCKGNVQVIAVAMGEDRFSAKVTDLSKTLKSPCHVLVWPSAKVTNLIPLPSLFSMKPTFIAY